MIYVHEYVICNKYWYETVRGGTVPVLDKEIDQGQRGLVWSPYSEVQSRLPRILSNLVWFGVIKFFFKKCSSTHYWN